MVHSWPRCAVSSTVRPKCAVASTVRCRVHSRPKCAVASRVRCRVHSRPKCAVASRVRCVHSKLKALVNQKDCREVLILLSKH